MIKSKTVCPGLSSTNIILNEVVWICLKRDYVGKSLEKMAILLKVFWPLPQRGRPKLLTGGSGAQ